MTIVIKKIGKIYKVKDLWSFTAEQILGYNEQGNQEWMNTDEGWNPYKRMLIQKRWEGFDGQVEHY